jgi:Flp pilus assembly protein TadB
MTVSHSFGARFESLRGSVQRNVQVARLAAAVEMSKPRTRGTGYALLALGVALGVLISFLLQFLAVLVMIALGFGLGYAARSYVSKRRRDRFLQDRLMR